MQSTSEGYFDVVELAKELRSEKLFIQSELEILQQLNERLEKSALELAQAKWTSTQQRSNLKQLFAQGDVTSSSCVPRTDYVLSPVFVDAHKVLRYQDALVLSELIQRVRASPAVASLWLTAAESRRPREAGAAARALCSGLYTGGGSGGPRDVAPLRKVLRHLATHRLATAEDPRRIIGQGSSSFSRLYSELVEGFRPARLFLSAALRGPFLPLLQLDECLLVDPDKAMDRIKKYCTTAGSSSECEVKLARYRKWTVTSLAAAANRFIVSLTENWACFPPSVAWVVRQTALILRATGRISEADIHSICTDLVFTNFICQAIANPEAYGITDIPITNVGRFNLAQVAQTIQMLCLMKHQEVDRKLRDLYSRFEKDSVYSLLDAIVDDETFSSVSDDSQQLSDVEEEILEGAVCDEQDMDLPKTEPVVNANVALFTRTDLQLLVSLLKKIPLTITNGFDSSPEQIINSTSSSSNLDQDFKELSMYDKNKSEQFSESTKLKNSTNGVIPKNFPLESGDHRDNNGETDTACGVTDNGDNGIDLAEMLPHDEGLNQLLRCIHPEHVMKLQKLLKRLTDCNFAKESPVQKPPTKGKHDGTNGNTSSPVKNGPKKPSPHSQEVLVIKLPGDTAYEPIGMVSESKVLECHYARSLSEDLLVPCVGSEGPLALLAQAPHNVGGSGGATGPGSGVGSGIGVGASATAGNGGDPGVVTSLAVDTPGAHAGQEKRTRFSLSHDEGSIGNTSDNLEAVSEAASNHSVTSSLEMETEDQNDNLSDMVSANVSGRGSPNISGRDTPSSQVTEGEAGVGPPMPQAQRHPASIPLSSTAAIKQAKLLKRTRHDIEDKFCKFEIKKLMEGDETISIISDTWSTDVLASDSETIGESYDRALITPTLAIGQQNALAAVVGQQALPLVQPNQPDVSETASESAWSTDALVSDSDRMTEVDMDECNSIARSDTGTVRSDGEPLPPVIPHPTVPQPHHQFSPLNNINRDALLNRRQMCAASSVHTAHPDNSPSMLNNILNGGLAINTSGENASSEESPEDMALLRSPPTRNANVSPPSFMNANNSASNSNRSQNSEVANRNTNGHHGNSSSFVLRNRSHEISTRRPVGYHARVSNTLSNSRDMSYAENNGIVVNGYPVSPNFSSRPVPDIQAGPSHAPCLDSPLSALDSPGQPAFYQGYRENHARPNLDMNVFDFSQQNDGMAEVINHHSILQPEISTPDGMFHSEGSAFVEASFSGSATSRWLNDPSQKFPIRPHAELASSPSSSSTGNNPLGSNHQLQNKPGTSTTIIRNNMDSAGHNNLNSNIRTNGLHDGMVITSSETVFRPIQVERDNLENGNNHIDLYSNNMQVSSNHANSINGFEDHFVDLPRDQYETRSNNVDLDYDRNDNNTPNVRMHSSVMTTQHSFASSNLVANSVSRVSKATESRTSIINISSSRIEKSRENKPVESAENNGCISSGSAISLSTLSVNSADTSTSDRSSSQDVNSENLTERRISPAPLNKVTILSSGDVKMHRMDLSSGMGCSNGANTLPRNSTMQGCAGSLKPGASTGAIPKSISFDATAEKSHRYHSGRRVADDSNEGSGLNFGDLKNNMKRSGGNLLNKIKLFRNKSRGFASSASGFGKRNVNQEYNEDLSKADAECELDNNSVGIVVNRGDDNLSNSLPIGGANTQKINTELSDDILAKYRRKASSSSDAATSDSTSNSGHSAGVTGNRSRGASIACDDGGNGSDGESAPDGLSDIASDIEFDSLKRKLRLVLSNMDIHSFEISNARSGWAAMACALRMENGPGALGVLGGIGARRGRTPLSSLRSDSSGRRPYAAYLATCRRALLSAIAATESEAEWQRGEALRQAALAAAARARVSLAAREPRLAALQEGLRAGLADDKRDTLAATLAALASDMAAEDAWAGASEWELEQAALTVERAVMSRVYLQAMFPNGDGDILRDQLLHDHISRLSGGGVGLPERRLAGAPWISAQRILAHLPAYKTPRDKVECVVRCLNSIMAMLSMSSEGSAPGADDLTPALVYVLIKANPPSLLSTVQFVSTFLSVPLEGEHLYCWTQFCSAVEFIKTMDYAQSSRR